MPNINLVADRREEKKKTERLTRQLFFGLAGSAGALALLVIFLGTQQLSTSGELADLNARMQQLTPTLERIKEVENETAELSPKVDTLQTARDATMRWRTLMQVVSQSVPQGAWLSAMSSDGTDLQNTSLRMSGIASSQTLVGQTMTLLQTHPYRMFDDVKLVFTTNAASENENDNPRYNFEITAHLTPPPVPAAPVKKDGDTAGGDKTAAAGQGGESNNG
jgi:Tfp pilus assembly protein PilN